MDAPRRNMMHSTLTRLAKVHAQMFAIAARNGLIIGLAAFIGGAAPPPVDWPSWVAALVNLIDPARMNALTHSTTQTYFAPLIALDEDPTSLCRDDFVAAHAPDFAEDFKVSLIGPRNYRPKDQYDVPCDRSEFGILEVLLRRSKGADPVILGRALDARFGPAETHDLTSALDVRWTFAGGKVVIDAPHDNEDYSLTVVMPSR